jgi:hypothetical protein
VVGAATHLYMCDLEGNKRDVARLLNDLAPGAQTFFVGHFGPGSRADVLVPSGSTTQPGTIMVPHR